MLTRSDHQPAAARNEKNGRRVSVSLDAWITLFATTTKSTHTVGRNTLTVVQATPLLAAHATAQPRPLAAAARLPLLPPTTTQTTRSPEAAGWTFTPWWRRSKRTYAEGRWRRTSHRRRERATRVRGSTSLTAKSGYGALGGTVPVQLA